MFATATRYCGSSWGWAALVGLAAGTAAMTGHHAAAWQARVGRGGVVEVHVKLKDQRATLGMFGSAARPLFTELTAAEAAVAGVDDPRARWVRVDVVASG